MGADRDQEKSNNYAVEINQSNPQLYWSVRTNSGHAESGGSVQFRVGLLGFYIDDQALSVGGGGTAAEFVEESFNPGVGQTIFVLSNSHAAGNKLSLACINAVCGYEQGTSYTISGTTFTWLNNPFSLDATDRLVVKHQTQ
jgi:hypothetical protein